MQNGTRKSTGVIIVSIAILIAVVVIVILGIMLRGRISSLGGNSELKKQAEENGAYIQLNEDNYVYRPHEDTIQVDEEAGAVYYSNLISAFLLENLDDSDREKLASSIDGVLVGDVHSAADMIQIYVEAEDLETINALKEELMKSDQVFYAFYEEPVAMEEESEDNNPWGKKAKSKKNLDKGNEENPSGNDWWAEAIGAYSAWKYYTPATKSIKVAVIDSGFDLDHKDLVGRIRMLNENSIESEHSSHGTMVAGLIGAANNEYAIRGILDQVELYAVDYNPSTRDDMLSTGEYLSYIMDCVEQGVKVINLSAGADHSKMLLFRESAEAIYEENRNTSLKALAAMMLMYMNGYDDYIIVQSAGNDKVDATENGYFCSISSERYDYLVSTLDPQLTYIWNGVNYNYFRDRVIIVGGVKNDRNGNNYQFYDNSNYGTMIDLVAPGQEVVSLMEGGSHDKINAFSGTSCSAPIVAGAAAFIWSMDPTMKASEVKEYLVTSTEKRGLPNQAEDTRESYPMLDLGNAAARVTAERLSEAPIQGPMPDVRAAEAAFKRFLEENVISEYGVMDTGEYSLEQYAGALSKDYHYLLQGVLSANIADFDGDGEDEMMVVRFSSSLSSTHLLLDMYEYDSDADLAYLASEKNMFDIRGFSQGNIGAYQLGIFTYTYEGDVYIGIETNFIANEIVNTVAIYQYGGKGYILGSYNVDGREFNKKKLTYLGDEFHYVGNVVYDHPGNGDIYVVHGYSKQEPDTPLWCRGSIAYEEEGWHVVDEIHPDQPDGSYVIITPTQERAFMDLYMNSLKAIGLSANDPRIDTAGASGWVNDQYYTDQTTTADVYTAVDGEITYHSGVYGWLDRTGGQTLYIEDHQHSLGAYR